MRFPPQKRGLTGPSYTTAEKRSFGQMWNFEDNPSAKGIIFRYTSKPETGYLFYNPLINFFISNMLGEKEKQKQVVSARANDANKHIDWLIFFLLLLLKLWLDQGLTGCRVKRTLATPQRSKLEKRSAFSLYFTDSTLWKLLKKPFLMYK